MKSGNKLNEDEVVKRCLRQDRTAQKQLYERYGPLMKAVCLRYLYEKELAEEVMNRGFYKVFAKLDSYSGKGSLEGWIRRIMVNESLNENQKAKKSYETDFVLEQKFLNQVSEVEAAHDFKHIMVVIEALPEGYRIVFNLFEIEGYNHREIAEKLGISESSSRSQLARAKHLLRQKLKNVQGI